MEKRDFSANKNDGFDLVKMAGQLNTSSAFLASDLSHRLFPKSEISLSDRLLSNCRQYLLSLVGEIESRLCLKAVETLGIQHPSLTEIGNSASVFSYKHLETAGLLRNEDLLNHIFTQAQHVELTTRLRQKISQEELENGLASRLDHDDGSVAEAAMALLVAWNRSGFQSGQIVTRFSDVPAETFHDLLWLVTAAVGKMLEPGSSKLEDAAQLLLREHDESQSVENRAQRLASLLERGAHQDSIPHPVKDGLHLFLARLAQRSGLSIAQLTMFTAEPNMSRLVIVMKALGIPEGEAISIFSALSSGGILLTPASYKEISSEEAESMAHNWSRQGVFQNAKRALSKIDQGMRD